MTPALSQTLISARRIRTTPPGAVPGALDFNDASASLMIAPAHRHRALFVRGSHLSAVYRLQTTGSPEDRGDAPLRQSAPPGSPQNRRPGRERRPGG